MDGFRFDDLARAVAGGPSRRSVLKGLAATLAAAWFPIGVPLTARAQNTVPLGGQCSALGANSECSQAGGAVVCSDNGIIRDGQFNCCRNTGGACSSDIQCCANLFCVNGTCGGTSSGTTSAGLAPGAQCTSSSQCSQSGGATVCADNGYDGDGPLNCCRNEGGACSGGDYSAGCCGGLYCVDGVCTNNRTGGLALGAECTQTGQCSQSAGATVCASNGIDSDGILNCCHNNGGSCDRDTVCCGGLLCTNGVCGTTGGGGGTIGLGGQCAATGECSQVGGAVFCDDNGIASDGALNCCRYEGGGCSTGSQCCGGLDCTQGVCQPIGGSLGGGNIALGGACAADAECTASGGASFCRNNGTDSDGSLNCCRFEGGACTTGSHCCSGLLCQGGVCA